MAIYSTTTIILIFHISALHLLRSKYDVIVQELPNDYEKTLQVVQDHLTDDQICDVLTSPNYTIANKAILNYLMEKVKCTANIVEFCDHLEAITSLLPDSRILTKLACELRGGKAVASSNTIINDCKVYDQNLETIIMKV